MGRMECSTEYTLLPHNRKAKESKSGHYISKGALICFVDIAAKRLLVGWLDPCCMYVYVGAFFGGEKKEQERERKVKGPIITEARGAKRDDRSFAVYKNKSTGSYQLILV